MNKVGVKCEELRKTGFDTEDKKISQMHELEDNWFCKVMLFSTLIVTGTSVTLGLLFGEYKHGTFFFPFCVLTFQQVENKSD